MSAVGSTYSDVGKTCEFRLKIGGNEQERESDIHLLVVNECQALGLGWIREIWRCQVLSRSPPPRVSNQLLFRSYFPLLTTFSRMYRHIKKNTPQIIFCGCCCFLFRSSNYFRGVPFFSHGSFSFPPLKKQVMMISSSSSRPDWSSWKALSSPGGNYSLVHKQLSFSPSHIGVRPKRH